MKKLTSVLTAALMMAVIATGCSKDESENMEENKQTYQYNYFEEPILDFSLTLEQLKAREKHQILHDNLWEPWPHETTNAPDPWLVRYVYNDQDIPARVCYFFPDKKAHGLYAIQIEWDLEQGINAKIKAQLDERYGEGETDESGRIQYISTQKGIRIQKGVSSVTYFPL
ncbi:MAG: hypothetical protein IJ647_02485 [Prevotella sp.]|nr:hypothetical protein [Prevotella sp.]